MDYKELLKKYIRYIRECEGVTYIINCDQRMTSDIKFTDEEWEELEALARERVE